MKTNINKKYILLGGIAIIIFACVLIFSFVGFNSQNKDARLTEYNLSLEYDNNLHILYGKEEVQYVNNSENMFTFVPFHLYPNAFREGAKNGVVSSNNVVEAYPNGGSYGEIQILGVCFENGEKADYEICGEDQNILKIYLKEELFPDECVIFSITFQTTLANINHRLGFGENTINFGNFYPIACVYEEGKGFSLSLYHSNGDPFYSECANYKVNIVCDKDFEIASSGRQENMQIENNKKHASYAGDNIRDFCFVLGEKLTKQSCMSGDVEVNYYGYQNDDNLQECLKTCVDALNTFENMFGKYPYSQLSVVKSNFVHGGMEYPNIVLISDNILQQNDVNYVIIHEIAHQWWYGMVGNDQYNHAWLDEGLAEYSTMLFYRDNIEYGEDFDMLLEGALKSYKLFEKVYTKVNGKVDGSMNRALCDYDTEPEYVQCTYTKGVLLFNTLREMVGDKKFLSSLKTYFDNYQYKIARPEDLISVFVDKCGKSVEGFFNSWLEGKVVIY